MYFKGCLRGFALSLALIHLYYVSSTNNRVKPRRTPPRQSPVNTTTTNVFTTGCLDSSAPLTVKSGLPKAVLVEPPMPPQTPSRDRVELLEADIRALPSVLEQIVELAHLRDFATGTYTHPTITERSRAEEIHRTLSRLHEGAFRLWLQMRLEAQKADFDVYLSSLGVASARVVEHWRESEIYRCLIPASASLAERQLFVGDIEVVLWSEQHEVNRRAAPQPVAASETAQDKEILTIREVAAWLRVAQRTLRQWAEVGIIPAHKMGRLWRFRRADIEVWLRGAADRREIGGFRHRRH